MKKFILLLLLSFPLLITAKEAFKEIENRATTKILSPQFREQKSVKIELENGLQAYIISDLLVDKSSAALLVKTGSWEDPTEYPGIAHFLEHMLFLGNKKYPQESEYTRYISEHGGETNAFTSNDFTGYIFSIDNKAFPEALDRFSNFFITPLFNPSGVDRELEAINQEYAKNIEDDDRREYFVIKELSDPSHPMRAFSMGNRNSLSKVAQETLKEWYKTHYSANRMRLEICSNRSLDELKTLVVQNFSSIPNSNLPALKIERPFMQQEFKDQMIYIEPIKNIRQLSVIWELPQQFAEMRDSRPGDLIGHIIGHEGKKSLLAQLKAEKLANGLQAGSQSVAGNEQLFVITVDLTDAGVKSVNTVILRCFETMARLKREKLPRYLFDELQTMERLQYQYQEREDAFDHIMNEALLLAREEMPTFPEQSRIIQKYDPKAVQEMLNYLTPKNAYFDLLAPKSLTGVETNKEEQWLGVHYAVVPINQEQIANWTDAKPNPQIDLPEPNPYIPENVTVMSEKEIERKEPGSYMPKPTAMIDNEQGCIYFAQNGLYSTPAVSWIFEIKTPSITPLLPSSLVLGDLFVKYATEALNDYTYPAKIAGLEFNIERTENGIKLSVDGFSDKADELFFDLLKTIRNLRLREQRFKTYKDALMRQYQDASLDMPIKQAIEQMRSILHKNYVLDKTKAIALRKINYNDLENFVSKLFEKCYTEGVVYGNMTALQSKNLVDQLIHDLASTPYPKEQQYTKEVVVFPDDKGPFYLEVKSKSQGNALVLAIELPEYSFEARAAQQVLMQGIKEPFYSALRTKQQTGYIVLSQAEDIEQHLFDLFGVQSNSHDGRDLLARFEEFLEGFLQELSKSEITQERFDNLKKALITDLTQTPDSTSDMCKILYKLAFSYNGDFDRIAKRIQAFELLTYDTFLTEAKESIGKENKRRFALILLGTIPKETSLQYSRATQPEKIKQAVIYEPAFKDRTHE